MVMRADLDCQIKRSYFQNCLLHTQFPKVDLSVHTVRPHFLCSSFSGGLGEGVYSAEMLSLGSSLTLSRSMSQWDMTKVGFLVIVL